jgi:GAF domain-containing protein
MEGRSPPEALQAACALLRGSLPSYRWVGIYLLEGRTLRLAAWDGEHPTEHVAIPLGEGVCGRAARERRVVNVADVRNAPEYLACFLETRSEIVVPIFNGGAVIGEIDVDGNEVAAYDGSDERFLMLVAERLSGSSRQTLAHLPERPIGPAPLESDPARPS